MTPLYNELVNKYYLSRGIVPFSYPHETIVIDYLALMDEGSDRHRGGSELRQMYFNLKG